VDGANRTRTVLRLKRHEHMLATKGDSRNFFERQLFKNRYQYIIVVIVRLLLSTVFIQTKVKVEWSIDDLRPIVPLPFGCPSQELQLKNRLMII